METAVEEKKNLLGTVSDRLRLVNEENKNTYN